MSLGPEGERPLQVPSIHAGLSPSSRSAGLSVISRAGPPPSASAGRTSARIRRIPVPCSRTSRMPAHRIRIAAQRIEELERRRAIIADRQHVATCRPCEAGARRDVAECAAAPFIDRSSAKIAPWNSRSPRSTPSIHRRDRLAGRSSTAGNTTCATITAGKSVGDQAPVRPEIRLDVGPLAAIDWHGDVRIGGDRAMSGEVLGRGRHARVPHAKQISDRQLRHGVHIVSDAHGRRSRG